MPRTLQPLGADTVDIDYPMYLINGRSSADPAVIDAAPGEQVRLRLINAAASTPFRIAASGGAMTVVASDGYELHALPAKTLVIGMGERYDVLVRAPRTGSMSLVAQGKESVPRFRRCFALRKWVRNQQWNRPLTSPKIRFLWATSTRTRNPRFL